MRWVWARRWRSSPACSTIPGRDLSSSSPLLHARQSQVEIFYPVGPHLHAQQSQVEILYPVGPLLLAQKSQVEIFHPVGPLLHAKQSQVEIFHPVGPHLHAKPELNFILYCYSVFRQKVTVSSIVFHVWADLNCILYWCCVWIHN